MQAEAFEVGGTDCAAGTSKPWRLSQGGLVMTSMSPEHHALRVARLAVGVPVLLIVIGNLANAVMLTTHRL